MPAIDLSEDVLRVASLIDGGTEYLRDPIGNTVEIPSSVFVPPDSPLVFGVSAVHRRPEDPEVYRNRLRGLVSMPVRVWAGAQELTPETVWKDLFRWILMEWQRQFPNDVRSDAALIVVPADWGTMKTDWITAVAREGGFRIAAAITETTAAVSRLATRRRLPFPDGSCLLSFHLGASGFAAEVGSVRFGRWEPMGLHPIRQDHGGGETFDAAVLDILRPRLGPELADGLDRAGCEYFQQHVMMECRLLKHILTFSDRATGTFHFGVVTERHPLTRVELEAGIEASLEHALAACQQLVSEVGWSCEQVTVVASGGSVVIPAVRARLEKTFGRPPVFAHDMTRAVVRGAAAELLWRMEDTVTGSAGGDPKTKPKTMFGNWGRGGQP